EDGIRDGHVTGVQTCALPISAVYPAAGERSGRRGSHPRGTPPPPRPSDGPRFRGVAATDLSTGHSGRRRSPRRPPGPTPAGATAPASRRPCPATGRPSPPP